MSQVTIDWNSIRPLNGGRDKGFEELCAQLANVERPAGSRFFRNGPPDAGVECYAVTSDGSEWGWQSKYFDTLGDSQWSQIDKSVKTALEKHRRLVRYFVCVPLDRPDARTPGRKSAMQRWVGYVAKWTKLAAASGASVEFVFWGSHELLERLTRPEHIGRVRFWFDVRGFDQPWFTARLEEAIRAAGPRYTPEINVELPLESDFAAFGRTESFFDHVKTCAKRIRDKLRIGEHATLPALNLVGSDVKTKTHAILAALGMMAPQPTGKLPFGEISKLADDALAAARELLRLLIEFEREQQQAAAADSKHAVSRANPFSEDRFHVSRMISELENTCDILSHGEFIAAKALLIVRGAAGTGKTHLLCDVARKRIAEGRPTVLLMGQRFLSNDAPWPQAMQHLDLAGLSTEEFIGALEAAAQAANSRALLMIDAVNEGTGRVIWPSHMAAFVAQIDRSPWVGVVVSVRSSYEEIVIPSELRAGAAAVTHYGFSGHEYDAASTFFAYYGLELPSTPLLTPEFSNPLFLKTLCSGLKAAGHRRLPRGFHGISAVFDLFLTSINQRLASSLGFDPKDSLVQHALQSFCERLLDTRERWLSSDQAKDAVNDLLPSRDFENSLYRALVVESLLIEDVSTVRDKAPQDVVYIAYERFADHLIVKLHLDLHWDQADPASAFSDGGALAFLCDKEKYVAPGLLEALCIQIPERSGREFVSIAPASVHHWGLAFAFRQSIIWRALNAFTKESTEVLNALSTHDNDFHAAIDTLLTVSTIPGHPFNAIFLDQRLRKDAMPDRDAWWSVYLHDSWGSKGPVDRLVAWAFSITPGDSHIDEEAIDLCAINLAWLFTTSNRFLRDRATQSLGNLLAGRLEAMARLVTRFADVDDPYVTERVYAVAYGVAMRSRAPGPVRSLAKCVYDLVFAAGNPPAHILLRDYARGVVELSIFLDSSSDKDFDGIRPPYKSKWPTIPTEDEIKSFSDWGGVSFDSGNLEWARSHIAYSVLADDFGRYVIGTNSSDSSNWLSLTLEQPTWSPPAPRNERVKSLIADFTDGERSSWIAFVAAELRHESAQREFVQDWFTNRDVGTPSLDELRAELERSLPRKVKTLAKAVEKAREALNVVLTAEHLARLNEIEELEENPDRKRPPRFDLKQIQRYVLWRVFDLGWTTERFGYFDRFQVRSQGREANKAERIGKKYQWIAYHEIIALIADHFQYLEKYRENDGETAYQGTWQLNARDIDPSCGIRSLRGGNSLDGHACAWWCSERFHEWQEPPEASEWVLRRDNLPHVPDFLIVTNPADGCRWFNVYGHFHWCQQTPPDQEWSAVERREIWYFTTGYLIATEDAKAFLEWAETVNFSGRWMPDAPQVYGMFLGEHGWGPASYHFRQQYYGDDGWTRPSNNCPVKVRTIAFEYLKENGGFDCSVDETFSLHLPASDLVSGTELRWSGTAADFLDSSGQLATQDPTAHMEGPSSLLLREVSLRDFLAREKLTICWSVIGEKRSLPSDFGFHADQDEIWMSGAYVLSEGVAAGFLKYLIPDANSQDAKVIGIDRTDYLRTDTSG